MRVRVSANERVSVTIEHFKLNTYHLKPISYQRPPFGLKYFAFFNLCNLHIDAFEWNLEKTLLQVKTKI